MDVTGSISYLDTEFEMSTEVRREERQCKQSISISGPKEVGHKGGDMRGKGGGLRPRK